MHIVQYPSDINSHTNPSKSGSLILDKVPGSTGNYEHDAHYRSQSIQESENGGLSSLFTKMNRLNNLCAHAPDEQAAKATSLSNPQLFIQPKMSSDHAMREEERDDGFFKLKMESVSTQLAKANRQRQEQDL